MAVQNPTQYYEEYHRYNLQTFPSTALPLYGYGTGKRVLIEGVPLHYSRIKSILPELVFTVSGVGTITLFNKEFQQKPGSVFIFFPGEEHSLVANSDLWTIRWLLIDGPLAAPILGSFNYPRHISIPLNFSEPKLDQIARTITESSPCNIRKTTAAIMELLCYPGKEEASSNSPLELIREARHYIHNNLSNFELDVNSIADYLGVHRSTFNRLFCREFNRTPHVYILDQRLNQSKVLLLGTRSSIAKIAELCGFRNDTTFCRSFKQKMHVTPSQYRSSGGGGTVAPDESGESSGKFLAPHSDVSRKLK